MMRPVAAVMLLLALVAVSQAEYPYDAVCNITAWPSDHPYQGMRGGGGSGTLLGISDDGRTGLVISAAHVFDRGNTRRITCEFTNVRRTCRGRLIGLDRRLDVAALEIESPPDIALPPVSLPTKDAEPYICVGYPGNAQGAQCWTSGPYLEYRQNDGMLHTATHVISGYSGGARFNAYADYCGVISGMTGQPGGGLDRTWGCGGKALLRFIGRFMEVDE